MVPTVRPRQTAPGARSVRVEANLFGRFFRVVKSYANQLVETAEDPEKILDQVRCRPPPPRAHPTRLSTACFRTLFQAVNEMQEDLVKLRQETAKYMGTLKQIEAKYSQVGARVQPQAGGAAACSHRAPAAHVCSTTTRRSSGTSEPSWP